METKSAVDALAALAQGHRLDVFRLLMREGPEGLPAGRVAERLGIPASTLSSHLAQLERAGLLRSRREQRRIIYAVDLEGTRRLLAFLIEDCCGGRPELCGYGRVAGGGVGDGRDRPQPDPPPWHTATRPTAGESSQRRREAGRRRTAEHATKP